MKIQEYKLETTTGGVILRAEDGTQSKLLTTKEECMSALADIANYDSPKTTISCAVSVARAIKQLAIPHFKKPTMQASESLKEDFDRTLQIAIHEMYQAQVMHELKGTKFAKIICCEVCGLHGVIIADGRMYNDIFCKKDAYRASVKLFAEDFIDAFGKNALDRDIAATNMPETEADIPRGFSGFH